MEDTQRSTPGAALPALTGALALILYLVTVNQWVSVRSLGVVAQVTGWDWTPTVTSPLYHLLTWPIRWFPEAWQPLALNVFAAICGALAVALLTRSVQLLPHDRTHDQRLRERSDYSFLSIRGWWVPPVLAAAAFGLQLTMWEHSTAATAESLDVLCLAFVIWCLLEFRVSHSEKWLAWMAFVYGLSVANNWAMIAFFPFALAAVVWIKGLRFFEGRFMLKLLLFGLAGLLLYLFLPLVWLLQKDAGMTFWDVLRTQMANQKMFLIDTPSLRVRALVLGLTSLLPLIIIGIRWPTTVGDTSRAGTVMTQIMLRVVHVVFFVACLLMAFDLAFSPRKLGFGLSFLSFYYLGALAVGYYSGYLMLVFREAPKKQQRVHPTTGIEKLLNPLAQALVWGALIVTPALLLYKNFPPMWANNGKILRELIAKSAEGLPKEPAALFSDDPFQLLAMRAHLASSGNVGHALVNTRLLSVPSYQERLYKTYPAVWPKPFFYVPPGGGIAPLAVAQSVVDLASTNMAYYLHPSFGYFFEYVHPNANGLIYKLDLFRTNEIYAPAPTPAAIQQNEKFWTELNPLIERIRSQETAADALYARIIISRGLNYWAQQLDRLGRTNESLKAFGLAAELNTNNAAAALNYEFARMRGGEAPSATPVADKLFAQSRILEPSVDNGPYNHPQANAAIGDTFLKQGLPHQAAANFQRAIELAPAHAGAKLGLANTYLMLSKPREALKTLNAVAVNEVEEANQPKLLYLTAAAHSANNDVASAERTLLNAFEKNPNNLDPLGSLTELYRTRGDFTNALATVEKLIQLRPESVVYRFQRAELLANLKRHDDARAELDRIIATSPKNVGTTAHLQHALMSMEARDYNRALTEVDKALQIQPNNAQALTYKGIVYFNLEKYPDAIKALDKVIDDNENDLIALRNRAITHLKAGNLDEAEADYSALQKLMPGSHAIYYGLGEVAQQKKDHAAAIRNFEIYLKLTPPNTGTELDAERKIVEDRVAQLKAGK